MRLRSVDGGFRFDYQGHVKPYELAPEAAGNLDLGPLPSLLGYALRRAQLAVFADFHKVCEPLGLRPAAYSVLLLLRHNPGVRASRLADTLGIQRTNFTTLLGAMEAGGLVERKADPRDRRAAALALTAAGQALLSNAERALAPHERRWRRQLGEADYMRLLELLGQVAGPVHPVPTQMTPAPGGSA